MTRTGLDQVFQQAISPSLYFLPRLTPEKESIEILEPAYQALLQLASVQDDEKKRVRLLDMLLRDGVLTGYSHAGEHISLAEFLLRQSSCVVDRMGVHAVKHLKVCIVL